MGQGQDDGRASAEPGTCGEYPECERWRELAKGAERKLDVLSVAARLALNEIQKWGAPPWTRACVESLELALSTMPRKTTHEVTAQRLADVMRVLDAVEWSAQPVREKLAFVCPSCHMPKEQGHADDCELAAVKYSYPQDFDADDIRAALVPLARELAQIAGLTTELCGGAPMGVPGPRKCTFTDLGFGGVVLGCRLAEGHGGGHKPGAPVIDGERCSATPPVVALRADAASIVGGMRCMLRLDHPGQHLVGTYRW